jgi:hypothetical protein
VYVRGSVRRLSSMSTPAFISWLPTAFTRCVTDSFAE